MRRCAAAIWIRCNLMLELATFSPPIHSSLGITGDISTIPVGEEKYGSTVEDMQVRSFRCVTGQGEPGKSVSRKQPPYKHGMVDAYLTDSGHLFCLASQSHWLLLTCGRNAPDDGGSQSRRQILWRLQNGVVSKWTSSACPLCPRMQYPRVCCHMAPGSDSWN